MAANSSIKIRETAANVSSSGPKSATDDTLDSCFTLNSFSTVVIRAVFFDARLSACNRSLAKSSLTGEAIAASSPSASILKGPSICLSKRADFLSNLTPPVAMPSTRANPSRARYPAGEPRLILSSFAKTLPIKVRFSLGFAFLSKAINDCWYLNRSFLAVSGPF